MSRVLLVGAGHCARHAGLGLKQAGLELALCGASKDLANALDCDRVFEDLTQAVEALRPTLVVLAGFQEIVPVALLKKQRCLNLHYSLLPKYRGLHTVIWAILNAETETGYTLHEADALIDHGPVVWQQKVSIGQKTSNELMQELDALVEKQIGKLVLDYLAGKIVPRVQDHSAATYVGRRNKADCEIDWNWSAAFVERFMRALVPPYPRPYFNFAHKRYGIVKAQVIFCDYIELAGHVVNIDQESVWIKLKDGLLRVYELESADEITPASTVLGQLGLRLKGR